ncbi:MAG: DUF262 domain-containing protein [Thermotogota bacterium]
MSENVKQKSNLKTRPVKDLKGYNFFVDAYQRGYKWTIQQVLDLLNDIYEYESESDKEEFYCLQPLVVKSLNRSDDKIKDCFKEDAQNIYEVIDGQQRITTLYIILNLLGDSLYTIKYQTRKASAEFLEAIKENLDDVSLLDFSANKKNGIDYIPKINEEWSTYISNYSNNDNIDNYHFFMAFLTAKSWIDKLDTKGKKDLLDNIKENTHFIWYEDTKHENPKEVFRNLNSGKTELTNAELIKALFINDRQDENNEIQDLRQNELARDWDYIEKTLNDDSFWFFISNETDKNKYPTRIDFLFELIVGKSPDKNDTLFTYRQYANETKKLDWDELKLLFYQLREWFEDRELYHLIGFIIYRKLKTIKEVKSEAENCRKSEFKEKLVAIIKAEFDNKDKEGQQYYNLENLSYHTYNETLNILLLHNIETYQKSDAAFRFPFDHLKKEKWSLEHIHAQNAEDFNTKQDICAWLEDLLNLSESWNGEGGNELKTLKVQINNLKDEIEKSDEDITQLQKQQRDIIKEKTDNFFRVHHISNLALLDKNTNSSLGNKNFKEKRKEIIQIDQQGWIRNKHEKKVKAFIPVATKNAFLKYYSKEVNQKNFWGIEDRADYLDNINCILSRYLNSKGKNNEQ